MTEGYILKDWHDNYIEDGQTDEKGEPCMNVYLISDTHL